MKNEEEVCAVVEEQYLPIVSVPDLADHRKRIFYNSAVEPYREFF